MNSKLKMLLFVLILGSTGLFSSCIGGKKSKCEECPEFTQVAPENCDSNT